jgi:hypothetical protein
MQFGEATSRHAFQADNDPVHRAAANDVDFRTRAARGSVCNGLLAGFLGVQ